jgi:hypothetical protein
VRISVAVVKKRTLDFANLADISHCGTLDHVPHGESFDSLVFRYGARAVGATQKAYMAASLLVAAAISSFLGLVK